jgi:uncharacterized protein (UPF0261 family)
VTGTSPRVLLIGTADTKSAEILYLREHIRNLGATALVMDVGVLAAAQFEPEISNRAVAEAAGSTLQRIGSSRDENEAMALMARGAARLAAQLCADKRIDGMLALGGTMGTDLALDVAAALPLGVPKVLLSTIAHSHLLPPQRIPPDLIMVLWAGGLFGLNSVCCSSLSQAAGAIVGACRASNPPTFERPLIGMTSLGSSGLQYMLRLKPELDARGYEVAVFHTTGMGGRAFETLASQGRFAAVFDFSLQELANDVVGSCVTAGPDRLRGAGLAGVPQIVAPGAVDMADFQAWQATPSEFADRPFHAHNRLIASASTPPSTRRAVAREMLQRLGEARGPTALILPHGGVEEWDRPGQPLNDPEGLQAFMEEATRNVPPHVEVINLKAHINDPDFSTTALALFDRWVAEGKVVRGVQ